jgi:tripartite-type tricarboxylate transporter receptor subunit TctC
MRHRFIVTWLILAFALFLGAPGDVTAQNYPTHQIQLVVPGGLMQDLSARVFAEDMGRNLGTQIVTINKPGASMTLGTDSVVRSKKDGYTLLYTATAPLIYPRIFDPKSVTYSWEKDLEPLGGRAIFPFTVTIGADSPIKTFADFIDYAKKNPGKLRIGTPGIQTVSNFNLELIKSMTGTDYTHVPIVSGPAISLLGGHIEGVILPITEVKSYVESGKMRILAVSNKLADFPSVPTLRELGFKEDLLLTWFAFYAPSGIPEAARKVLVPALEKAVNNPQVQADIRKINFLIDYKSPTEMKAMIAREDETVSTIAAKIGLRK